MTPAVRGRRAIKTFPIELLELVPEFRFHDLEVLFDTPDHVLAEYKVNATTTTGRPYEQFYAGRLHRRGAHHAAA